jgi:hypothetical protein
MAARPQITMGEDGWITFVMEHSVARLIKELRRLLDSLMQAKIEQPQLDLRREGAQILRAAIQVITTE